MAKFDKADFLRKHGAKLRTSYTAPDGTKMSIPGFPVRMTPAGIADHARGTSDADPIKVTLAEAVANGTGMKRNAVIWGDAAGQLVEYDLGKGEQEAEPLKATA